MGLRLLVGLGWESGAVALGLALLLTYSAHSLLWVAMAALLTRARAMSSATQHLLWKMALFGPILSALLAVVVSGVLARSAAAPHYVHEVSFAHPVSPPSVEAFTAATARAPAPVRAPRVRGSVILTIVLAAAGLGCFRFIGSALLIRRRIRERVKASDARVLRRLERVRRRIGVRDIVLTESPRVESPLVLGTTEICLPRALHQELTCAELDAVFAHELAHIERKDGLWFPLVGALQCMLWFSPMNYWASCRFRESAEQACDDRAVELTQNPLVLARALVRVATRSSLARRFAMTPAMFRTEHGLLPRLRRLTGTRSAHGAEPSGRAGVWATTAIVALASALVSLNIGIAEARAARPPLPAQRSPQLSGGPKASAPPDVVEQSRLMGELLRREQSLIAQLEAAQRLPNELEDGAPDSVRVLELSQELRHVRANELFLETRFVEQCAAWDKAHSEPRRADR